MNKLYQIAFLLLLISPLALLSQANTTASVTGFVYDTEGMPLQGATILLEHVPTGTKTGGFSTSTGKFTVVGLKIGGPYKMTVSMVGREKVEQIGIWLSINQNYDTKILLPESGVTSDEVTVTADKNEIISANRMGSSQHVSQKDIDALPTISRSIHDYSRLSPLVVSSTGSGSNVAGRNSKFNSITVDGAIMSDAFGLASSGTPGGQAGSEAISLDAIQEFEVSISPFDVREGGFTGGLLNAITKGGTNSLSGSVYYYTRNQAFIGDSPLEDKDGNRAPYPDFDEMQIGGRVGGAIIENELFFFVNGEYKKRNDPTVIGLLGDNEANIFPLSRDTFNLIRDAAINNYGYDPGSFDQYTRETDDFKIFLKLDYNLSPQHRLSLRHNMVNANQGNDIVRDFDDFSLSNQEYIFNSVQNQTVLQLNSIFGQSMANEFRAAYTTIRDKRDPVGSPFPQVTIQNLGTEGKGDVSFGVGRFSQANSLDQDIIEITNNFNYFLGDHVITIGTNNQIVSFKNLFLQDYYGNWEFASLDDFIAGKSSRRSLSWANTDVTGGSDKPFAEFSYAQIGFYLQDEWSVLSNMKVTGGVRIDMFSYLDDPYENDRFANPRQWFGFDSPTTLNTSEMPAPVGFSPRLGFNWDVQEDRQIQVRGGIGLFSGRTPGVWISNQFSNTGVDIFRLDERNPTTPFVPDPFNQPRPDNVALATAEINVTDPDFKMPQIMRGDLALDYQLPMGFIGTVEFLYGQAVNDVFFQNINIQYQEDGNGNVVTAPDGRPMYQGESNATKVDSNFTRVLLMTNTDKGSQTSFILQLQKPYGAGILPNLSANLAYTYNRTQDLNSLTSSRAISNWQFNPADDPNDPSLSTSNFEVRNRILANLNYTFEYLDGFATSIGLFYEGRSGSPFSFLYYTSSSFNFDPDVVADSKVKDANNDNIWGNDLIYVPTGPEDPDFILTSDNWNELNAFLDQFDGLDDQRGKIMERNSITEPWVDVFDIRISQVIPTFEDQKIELYLDILNVLNLLNPDWGHDQYINFGTYGLFRFEGYDKETGAVRASYSPRGDNTFDDLLNTNDLNSRWQMQFGIRYTL